MQPKKPWYADWQSLGAVVLGVLAVGGISQITSTPSTSSSATQPAAAVVTLPDVRTESEVGGVSAPIIQAAPARVAPAPAAAAPPQTTHSETLSNDNYYENVDGNTIHSPAYTDDNSVPAGASAQCRDGTYSFSANRRGTCSHHGGVARWL